MRQSRYAACAEHIRPSARFVLGLGPGLRRAPPPRRGISWPGRSGAPYFPHRRPVEHKQRGARVPPASASGQECCVLRQGLQDAETAREVDHAGRTALR